MPARDFTRRLAALEARLTPPWEAEDGRTPLHRMRADAQGSELLSQEPA